MSKECAFCGKTLGFLSRAYDIVGSEFTICESHLDFRAKLKDEISAGMGTEQTVRTFKNSLPTVSPEFDAAVSALIKELGMYIARGGEDFLQEERKRIAEEKALAERLMLTTGSFFEGYSVERYIDVICEEVIFKNSFVKQLGASFEDFGNSLSFSEREMTGASELISKARAYTLDKFRRKAARVGANAVLGIDFESSFGSDVVRVCVSGTAVVIQKKDGNG